MKKTVAICLILCALLCGCQKDAGAVEQGDGTTAKEEQKRVYQIVKEAQAAGLSAIRAGISGKEADAVARKVIDDAGYGKYFGHSLGHGVGLLIHEQPNLSPLSETILKPGMVVTCEPGIYIPDFGGVRIEDMVCVGEDGCENLTHLDKELIEL